MISGDYSDSSDKEREEGRMRKERATEDCHMRERGGYPQRQQEVIKHPKQENDVAKFIYRRSSLTLVERSDWQGDPLPAAIVNTR